jgi:demethylmenaquinone methyltransferase/2-methoxy-6-polyprenyl-1,4-benzoquinol methylase
MGYRRLLVEYYDKRTPEFDRIYEIPERQKDIGEMKELVRRTFAGHDVLEIACGTGYWTEVISQSAKSITAIDVNAAPIKAGQSRTYRCPVAFRVGDAFDVQTTANEKHTGAFASGWWSHIPKSDLKTFLLKLHRVLQPHALVVFLDNVFAAGLGGPASTPISRTDAEGNTWQKRKISSGEQFEIIKNFPTKNEVEQLLADVALDIRWTALQYFWLLEYRVK